MSRICQREGGVYSQCRCPCATRHMYENERPGTCGLAMVVSIEVANTAKNLARFAGLDGL